MRRGYIQVYTGSGKGKTTAALGLAVRAAGAGHRVYFAQFIKKRVCSEHKALARFSDLITVKQFGTGFLEGPERTEAERKAAARGFDEIASAIRSSEFDVVILDEINIAIKAGLVEVGQLLELLESKPSPVEVVLTGRYADPRVVGIADLVTEMHEIKHYHNKGVKARTGIEM
ncbi:MAG TPA: cob(I)yrinic acid a,c-diamide adenosyltransferase [Dissulfurispiraceae bacterium]|nr:cob(I)yrinic acid a,c-diamide adenosyltransferase [Dissulfurispiraceae bacterium]